ncbi:MAG: hypothetical protein HC877_04200 [Thioploca sp.]|nr:hypothetical protein [Thioploca sp.]
MPEAARINDTHNYPQQDHASSTIVTGQATVLICGQPTARISDTTSCGAAIASGEVSVIIGGMPAARQGDFTNHGGYITSGCSTVLIGKPAQAECLGTDKPLVDSSAPAGEPPATTGQTTSSVPTAASPSLLEQIQQAMKDTPLEKLTDAILTGKKELFALVGGVENFQLVNQSLNVVSMVSSAMGKANPLGDLGSALNLLDPGHNALTQVGSLLALSGEEKCGGALSLLGGAVGGGQPMTLLASTAYLVGEEKLASLCTLGSGNISHAIQDVNTLLPDQEPASNPFQGTSTVQVKGDAIENQSADHTAAQNIFNALAQKGEPVEEQLEEQNAPTTLTPNDDNNPFI